MKTDQPPLKSTAIHIPRKGHSPLLKKFVGVCSWFFPTPISSRAIRWICNMEFGQMWSQTFRTLLLRHHGVEVGMYSYGPALWPGGLPEGTRIGNYCSLAAGISVFRRNHPSQRIAQHPFFYNASLGLISTDSIYADANNPLTIGDDVWIGTNVIITPRCQFIGLGAVIGAGAVVTKDVPPFAIVAGNPARQIGTRFTLEIQHALIESRWWEYPIDQLIPILPLFLEDATLENAMRLRKHLQAPTPPR